MAQQYIVEGGKLKHNGLLYKSGDQVKLEDNQAKPLLACGRVKLIEAPAQPEQPVAPQTPAPAPQQPVAQPEAPAAPQGGGQTVTPPAQPQQPAQPITGQPTPDEIAKTASEVA